MSGRSGGKWLGSTLHAALKDSLSLAHAPKAGAKRQLQLLSEIEQHATSAGVVTLCQSLL